MDTIQGQFAIGEELFSQDLYDAFDFPPMDPAIFDDLSLVQEWGQNSISNESTGSYSAYPNHTDSPSTTGSSPNTSISYYESPNTNISASPEVKAVVPTKATKKASKANGKGAIPHGAVKKTKKTAPSAGIQKSKPGQKKRGRKAKEFNSKEEVEEHHAKARERNRLAAAKCRVKKKKETCARAEMSQNLSEENEFLRVDLCMLKNELINLYEIAMQHQAENEAAGVVEDDISSHLDFMKRRLANVGLGNMFLPSNIARFREERIRQAAADAAAMEEMAQCTGTVSASMSPALSGMSLGAPVLDQTQAQPQVQTTPTPPQIPIPIPHLNIPNHPTQNQPPPPPLDTQTFPNSPARSSPNLSLDDRGQNTDEIEMFLDSPALSSLSLEERGVTVAHSLPPGGCFPFPTL